MAFKSIGQRMGFVSIADAKRMAEASGFRKGKKKGKKEGKEEGREEGLAQGMQKGIKKEQANSEKNMNLLVKRIAKKFKVPEEELLALKP